MTVLLILLGFLLVLAGIAGCVYPIVPGPLLAFLSLLLISWAKAWQPFSPTFLIVMGAATVALAAVDYLVPAMAARRYGATRYGLIGGTIGMIVGIFFVPPFGVFLGMFLGALVGELAGGSRSTVALKTGWGVFIGNLAAAVIKLAYCGTVLFFYVRAVIS